MNSQKGNVLIIIPSLIAVIALILAGYFFFQNQSLQKPKVETVVKDETVNWKTLQSVYGYSINYPTNWFVFPASKDRKGSIDQIESYDVNLIKTPGKGGFEKGQIKLEMGKDSQVYNMLGVEERIELDKTKYISKEKTTLAGKPSVKIVQDGPGGQFTVYFIEGEYPNVYFIAVYGDLTGNNDKLVSQILGTFKFIE